MTAETLTNGKFMKTVWGRIWNGTRWLIVFAKGDVAVTVIRVARDDRRITSTVVRRGAIYIAVEEVNRKLMEADKVGSDC